MFSDLYISEGKQLTKAQITNVQGAVTWRSASNIALVKYWGKRGVQLPCNPSVSFTLRESYTQTTLEYASKPDEGVAVSLLLDGQENEKFRSKVATFFDSLTNYFPFVQQLAFTVRTHNTFPHSTGIASSASGMSALALCLCDVERKLFGTLSNDSDFYRKASYIARLGSGSAARSIYAKAAAWGYDETLAESSDEYATPVGHLLHPVFNDFCDAVLIVDAGTKKVSSRVGHSLMNDNPYAEGRYKQARQNFRNIMQALQTGDLQKFIDITEIEALSLHGLMMSSGYTLLHAGSLHIIEEVQNFRRQTNTPVCFTLDAGPNVHVLYPKQYQSQVREWLHARLLPHTQNNRWIDDGVGNGATQ